jgi:peptidoglycan/LPS O-acetylase OafA/YrhL
VRGIAVLLVLVFHYARSWTGFGLHNPLKFLTELGWVGVDLFFVLSGFLITGILCDNRSSPNYFRNFYARRTLRIFPLYYMSLLFILLISTLWPTAGVWPEFSLFWFGIYATNFVMATGKSAALLGHFWTLAVEEQFYLLWPLAVALGTRSQLMRVLLVVVAAAFVLRVTLILLEVDPFAVYVLTPTRMDTLAVGAFCALAIRSPAGMAAALRWAKATFPLCCGVFICIALWKRGFLPLDPVVQTVGYTIVALGCASGLILALGWRPFNAVADLALFRWLGKYSYGLYVWHVIINILLFYTPLKDYLGITGPILSGAYVLFAMLLVFGVSILCYHFLERPFLQLKSRFRDDEPHPGQAIR